MNDVQTLIRVHRKISHRFTHGSRQGLCAIFKLYKF